MIFGLRITTKREIGLWMALIEDLKKEVERLRKEADLEKSRADAILNVLLAKTQGLVIERRSSMNEAEREAWVSGMTNIFDEVPEPESGAQQESILERAQS